MKSQAKTDSKKMCFTCLNIEGHPMDELWMRAWPVVENGPALAKLTEETVGCFGLFARH